MNDTVEAALAGESGDAGFARDTHTRFLTLFGKIVLKTDTEEQTAADPAGLRQLIGRETGRDIPADPGEQLRLAIAAVFESSQSRRARSYRRHYNLPDDMGTAVTVQAMVFGNLDDQSGTGVLFTRNPLTGERTPYGEYLPRGQGEDVVSGRHTPEPLSRLAELNASVHGELLRAAQTLEDTAADVQDIEFTVQKGVLYLLQTRSAKRAPEAAVRIAVEMVDEGLLTPAEALGRVSAEQVRMLLRPHLAPKAAKEADVLAQGEPACPGVGRGVCVTDPDEAHDRAAEGEEVVLVRESTSPDDVHGMIAAHAVVTETGGATSHAAVVSRGLGRPCVVGCGAATVKALAGRPVTVDGDNGVVYAGLLDIERPDPDADPHLRRLGQWADETLDLTILEATPAELEHTVVDLDFLEGADGEPDELRRALQGVTAVKGALLARDDVLETAVEAGVTTLIVPDRLLASVAVAHLLAPEPHPPEDRR
jgi:pyruvate,orthophosphate dikinase